MEIARRRRSIAALGHRDFALLLLGQTVSRFGDRVYAVALPFQVLGLGASPIELGVAAALLDGSHLLFLLAGGAIADRISRRRIILSSDLVAGLVVGAMALLSATGALALWHVYVASAIFGAAEAFFSPAYTAIIPELVPTEVLQSGNAARSLSRSLARIGGPALGGLMVVTGGPALAFGFDAVTFAFSLAALLFVRQASRVASHPKVSLVQDVREGSTFALRLPWLIAGALGYALLNLVYSGQTSVIMPLLVRDVLRGDAATFGLVTAAFGTGAVLGGLLLAQSSIARAGVGIYAAELAAALCVLLMGLVTATPVVLVLMLGIGVALTGSDVMWQTALQRHIPAAMRGRVSSIASLGTLLLNPFAPLIAGALVQTIGPAPSLTAGGVYAAVIATALLLGSPLRKLR